MRVAALVIAVIFAGASPTMAAVPPTRATAATVVVELLDDRFSPTSIRIEPGDSIMWVNHGRSPHDVVEFEGAFASKILQTGDSFTVRFPKIGRVSVYCSLHGAPGVGMHAEIYVGIAPEQADSTSGSRSYPADPPARPPGGRTLRVPRDFASIQAAVDAASPGDMVLIAPGIYREAVRITTPHLTLRGEDRNMVILDGAFDPALKNGVAVFGADGVVIENMTARHFQLNGFYWRSVWGYRASYVTAEGNGDYGVYASDSGVGQIDHSYASGSPDAGFYIGQCDPCNALVTDVLARWNGIGFSGTNATGNLVVRDSEWTDNMSGIVPNTLDGEGLAPERGQTVVGNWVHDNGNTRAPVVPQEYAFFGIGIAVLGGRNNEIAYNRVSGHPNVGIAVSFVVDQNLWLADENRVHDNVVWGSGIADLALVAPAGGGNCFATNVVGGTLPPFIEGVYSCGAPISTLGGGDVTLAGAGLGRLVRANFLGTHPHGDSKDTPATPPQPNMPDITGPAAPAGPPSRIDTAAEVKRAAARFDRSREPEGPSAAAAAYALVGALVPIGLIGSVALLVLRARRRRPLGLRVTLLPLGVGLALLLGVALVELLR